MAGAKKPTRGKKRRSRSAPTPTSPSIRVVRSSTALGAADAARRLGVSAATLRRRAQRGEIRASIDERGRYHFPGVAARSAKKRSVTTSKKKRASSSPLRKKRRVVQSAPVSSKPAKRKLSSRPLKKRALGKKLARPAKKSVHSSKVRHVQTSRAPSIRQAARAFGISVSTLVDRIRAGDVRATLDAAGELHVPQLALQVKELGRRKKKRRRAPPPAPTPDRRRRRKLAKKKKKRVRKTRPRRERFQAAVLDDTRPSREFVAPTTTPPAEPTRSAPMAEAAAAQRIGNAMRDFVMARPKWERLETGKVFHDLKTAYRSAYDDKRWRRTYAWIVDEWGLEDYIFDYEALRDS